MRKLFVLLLIGLIIFSAGCTQKGTTSTETTQIKTQEKPSETQMTTSTPTQTQAQGINFKEYKRGEIIGNWWKLFDTSVVYVSKGYEDLAKHYFPNAQIKPASEFESGIAILRPKDARELLRGKPMLITINDYFGYVLYKVGYKFVGQDMGMIVAYKENSRDRLIFTGNGRAGTGVALKYALDIKEGKRKPKATYVLRRGDFEGIVLKEIGDNNWNGILEKGEYWTINEIYFKEPFIYNWRIVNGENITVSGGFIRYVNGSRVYIYALSFNVSVEVKNGNGAKITYIVENVNPSIMKIPENAETGDTWIKFTTTEKHFVLQAKSLENFTFLAFGDHRPGSGKKVPEAFLKVRDSMNNDSGAFIIDGGDLVYSGKVEEWGELFKAWKFNKPVFIAVGNHEYQGEGVNIYHKYFGPTDYSFVLGNYYFIFMNNVENGYSLSASQWKWLKNELEKAKKLHKNPIIVMHTPPVDPRPGGDHSMKSSEGKKLLNLMKEYNAFGVFSHIHIYWYGEKNGVSYVVTGGGGAPLYAKPDEGGFYHYVKISVDGGIQVEPIEVS